MKHTIRMGAAVGLLALAAGAAPALAQETPVSGGTLKFATQGEPNTYDCHAGTSIVALQYLAPHYSSLIAIDNINYPEIVGDLAKEWSVSDDGLTYSFTLHPDVKFHDGTPLTSADVKASFDRIANPPEGVVSIRKASYAQLASIETPAPDQIVFKLKSPSAGFLSTLANPWNCVYSAKKMAEDPSYPAKTIMGSGPFVFGEFQAGSFWKGTKFADYFVEGKPYLDGFEAHIVSGAAVANTIAGGQLDANFRLVSVPEMQRIKDSRGDTVTFQTTPSTSFSVISINTRKKPFDDPRVRKALSLAIDRDAGINVLGDLAGQRWKFVAFRHGHALAPSAEELAKVPGFGPDIEANRAEARRLLEEAGVKNLSFTFLNRSIKNPYEPLAIFFIDQWRQIGVTVTQEALENGPWAQKLQSGDYEVGMDLNSPPSDDPTEVLTKYVPGAGINYTGLEDQQLVDLFRQQDASIDEAERAKLVRAFVDRMVELTPTISTYNAERNVVFDNKVKGWKVPPSFLVGLSLRDVWLAK